MRTTDARQGRFHLGWALVASVVFHLVLLWVAGWLPLGARIPVAVEKETVLKFDFARPAERDARGRGSGAIVSPEPPSRSAPRVSPPPSAAEPAVPPSATETSPRPRQATPRVENRPHPAPSADDLPGPGEAHPGEPAAGAPAERTFDLERALRDFRGAIPRQRDSRSGEGSGGEGAPGGLNIPDLPPLPGTGFGFGNMEFESRDYDWTDYARQIYMAIWRAWHNRLYATVDAFEKWGYQNRAALLDHQDRIRFVIERSGEVTGVLLETPSGCVPLDDSALDALREVILPPLPADFPRDREVVHARFIASGEIQGMRPTLRYLKAIGLF